MKRSVCLILSFIFILCLTACGREKLSEAQLAVRKADYERLTQSLRAVGYDHTFSLDGRKTLEDNLRQLWSEPSFNDARKNAELLVTLKNYDFIAEGLRTNVSRDNPYYKDWPKSSDYIYDYKSSKFVSFERDEILWLVLLLPDEALPEEHSGLVDVFTECVPEAFRFRAGDVLWMYHERVASGLFEKLHPGYCENNVDNAFVSAFRQADKTIQDRLLNRLDFDKEIRDASYRPRRNFTSEETEEFLTKPLPSDVWKGGYFRVVDVDTPALLDNGNAELYSKLSDSLTCVSIPANARFAIYEQYTDKKLYDTYTVTQGDGFVNKEGDLIEVYTWNLFIRIVDLTTGKEILKESVRSSPPPNEIEAFALMATGKTYNYLEYDYEKYVTTMKAVL